MGEWGNTAWARVGFVLAGALGACSGGSNSTVDEVIEDTDEGTDDGIAGLDLPGADGGADDRAGALSEHCNCYLQN